MSGNSYSYAPSSAGACTLTFKASDLVADSGTYTVTLTVTAAPAYTAVLSGRSAYYDALLSYTDTNDQWGIASLMAYNPPR